MKERERENKRVQALLGKITLPETFWDEKRFERIEVTDRTSRTGSRTKSGLLTPPQSCSSDESDSSPRQKTSATSSRPSAPTLLTFSFSSPPSENVTRRWHAILGQIQLSLIAKEKALRHIKEEMELKLERAREVLKEEKEAMQRRKASRSTRPSTAAPTSSATSTNNSRRPLTSPQPPQTKQLALQSKPSQSTPTTAQLSKSPSPSIPQSASIPASAPTVATSSAIPPVRKQPMKGRRKRAQHANSLNSHHRDNYVPSRTPALPAHPSTSHSPLTSWPASAEAIANRKPSRYGAEFFGTADEYTCAWCDYDILFGDSSKAIKKRKKLLQVRKKSEERAASTVAGPSVPASSAEYVA